VPRCSCCGSPIELFVQMAGKQFCADCLERARSYDPNDPYDEIGEGD
jgi:hypothetical protein